MLSLVISCISHLCQSYFFDDQLYFSSLPIIFPERDGWLPCSDVLLFILHWIRQSSQSHYYPFYSSCAAALYFCHISFIFLLHIFLLYFCHISVSFLLYFCYVSVIYLVSQANLIITPPTSQFTTIKTLLHFYAFLCWQYHHWHWIQLISTRMHCSALSAVRATVHCSELHVQCATVCTLVSQLQGYNCSLCAKSGRKN